MLCYSKTINKNYAFEISGLHLIRNFLDGITFYEWIINLDLYKGDHNPKFHFMITFLNFKLVEINIYNMNHVTKEEDS